MAEFSGFWTTTGAPAGHQQASYTQAQWSTATAVMAACAGFEGVAPGYLNSLAGTVTGANTVAINTGGAVVDGKFYQNGASVNVNIPSAVGGGNTRIDRIVLRASWAGFTVVITRIAGTDAASPTAPAITQTPGTTYDIMLYQALVDTGGTVTITDERVFARPIANRQGGSSTIWDNAGTTSYVVAPFRMEFGSGVTDGSGFLAVTFPVAFANHPLVFCTSASGTTYVVVAVQAITENGFSIFTFDVGGNVVATERCSWLAIGPI